MNETELAQAVASGALPSPQRCAKFWIVALRITGTGLAFRKALDEHCYRPPENYLTPEFLARCSGLPVIAMHPDGALTSEEYEARSLGAIMFAYIAGQSGIADPAGDEVWGVARIYSDEVVEAMSESPLSTSPAVIFTPADGNQRAELEDGSALLIEGVPSTLCHLAICDAGVWDKLGPPAGVRFDNQEGNTMTEEEMAADRARKDAETAGNIDKILKYLDDGAKKMDAVCSRLDALEKGGKKEPTEEERERADRARKDLQSREHGTPWTAADAAREREEHSIMADSQCRADVVYQAWGLRAPIPMHGEKPIAYRRRLLRGVQRHSTEFKDSSLEVLSADAKTFEAVETRIYAAAVAASKNPVFADGHSEKRVRHDPETGHRITTFHGGPTIFKQFSQPTLRVTAFKLTPAHAA
jgi:hypothetical protein